MTNQADQSQQRPVVVGIDGSERSTAALEWAASYAQATGTTVRAVAAWQNPSPSEFDVGGGGGTGGRVQKDSREPGGISCHPPSWPGDRSGRRQRRSAGRFSSNPRRTQRCLWSGLGVMAASWT